MRIVLATALVCFPALASAAPAMPEAAPGVQAGIGPTGTMYNGNNAVRSPVGRAPPAAAAGGGGDGGGDVTSTSSRGGSADSTGAGAGGGEH